jgi:hypothetical protein
MSTDVKITYVNKSNDTDKPTVFVFTKNLVPTFDVLKDGVAWQVMPNIGKDSQSEFIYPINTMVQAIWGDCNKTRMLEAEIGKRYTVLEDHTGIVLTPNGNSSQSNAIEVNSLVQIDGGIEAQLVKDGKVIMTKKIAAYDQKATFILHPKLYWGLASEIQEGQLISSAVLRTDNFFEQDIEDVLEATVTLTGNAKEGYQFSVENKS